MERITKARVKRSNGFSDPIPIGTSSEYVKMQDGSTLESTVGGINVSGEGSIKTQLTNIKNKIGNTNISNLGNSLTEAINYVASTSATDILASPNNDGKLSSEDYNVIHAIPQRLYNPGSVNSGYVWKMGNNGTASWQPDANTDTWQQNSLTQPGYVPAPGANSFSKFWGVSQNGTLGWQGTNSINASGIVPAPGSSNKNSVWMTDNNGNPSWRNLPLNSNSNTAGIVAAAGSNQIGKVWKVGSDGKPGWNSEEWKPVSTSQNGYVMTPGANNTNKYLGTDGSGNIKWLGLNGVNNAGLVSAPGKDNANMVWKTNADGIPGWRADTNIWKPNLVNQDGYVPAPTSSRPYRVWRTDENGNPQWGTYPIANKDRAGIISTAQFHILENMDTSGNYTRIKNLDGSKRVPIGTAETSGQRVINMNSRSAGLAIIADWGATSTSARYLSISSSDTRLKQNIKSTKASGLDLINKINLYEFDWKEDHKNQKLGFIANYLKQIDPNLVIGEENESSYLSVNTFYLQGFEVKAIQQLSEELNKAKKEIKELKQQIEKLK